MGCKNPGVGDAIEKLKAGQEKAREEGRSAGREEMLRVFEKVSRMKPDEIRIRANALKAYR